MLPSPSAAEKQFVCSSVANARILCAWANTHLKTQTNERDLLGAFDDGARFFEVMKVVFERGFARAEWLAATHRRNGRTRTAGEKQENLRRAVDTINDVARAMKIPHRISVQGVVKHNETTLEALFILMYWTEVYSKSPGSATGNLGLDAQVLLHWCQERLRGSGVVVSDLAAATWSDGHAFFGLIPSGLRAVLPAGGAAEVLEGAFAVFEANLQVPRLLKAGDFQDSSMSNTFLVVYLCAIRQEVDEYDRKLRNTARRLPPAPPTPDAALATHSWSEADALSQLALLDIDADQTPEPELSAQVPNPQSAVPALLRQSILDDSPRRKSAREERWKKYKGMMEVQKRDFTLGPSPTKQREPTTARTSHRQQVRCFWQDYLDGNQSVPSTELIEVFDSWLVSGDIALEESRAIVTDTQKMLNGGVQSLPVSLDEFEKFTKDLIPFTPAGVRAAMTSPDYRTRHCLGDLLPEPKANANGSAHTQGNSRYLELIQNVAARDFWKHYMGSKRAPVEEFEEAFEGWLVNGGISDDDCNTILQHAGQSLDRQRTGNVSYGEFNKFTMALVPFTPTGVRDVIISKQDVPTVTGTRQTQARGSDNADLLREKEARESEREQERQREEREWAREKEQREWEREREREREKDREREHEREREREIHQEQLKERERDWERQLEKETLEREREKEKEVAPSQLSPSQSPKLNLDTSTHGGEDTVSSLTQAGVRTDRKYLDLIINEGARNFWEQFVEGTRLPVADFMDLVEVWFLKGGVSVPDAEQILHRISKTIHRAGKANDSCRYN